MYVCMHMQLKNTINMRSSLHPWVNNICALDLQFVLTFQTFYNSPLTSQVSQKLGVHHALMLSAVAALRAKCWSGL